MVKYVCDMCGKPLLEDEDVRYVVKIEVYVARDVYEPGEGYDDIDPVDEMLDSIDTLEGPPADDGSYAGFRFDLCPECRRRYLEDPLVRPRKRRIEFSDN